MVGDNPVSIDPVQPDALQYMSTTHAAILLNCLRLEQYARPPARRAALPAALLAQIIAFFDNEVALHHRVEDEELFPRLLALHLPLSDMRELRALVAALGDDHRMLDTLWRDTRPQLIEIAAGKPSPLPDMATFAASYRQHLKREDAGILPFARRYLDGMELAALARAIGKLREAQGAKTGYPVT